LKIFDNGFLINPKKKSGFIKSKIPNPVKSLQREKKLLLNKIWKISFFFSYFCFQNKYQGKSSIQKARQIIPVLKIVLLFIKKKSVSKKMKKVSSLWEFHKIWLPQIKKIEIISKEKIRRKIDWFFFTLKNYI